MLAGGTPLAMDLALVLGIVGVADRWRRTGNARPWMIFTPATALILLIIAGLSGALALGIRVAMLLAIGSAGALLLRRAD